MAGGWGRGSTSRWRRVRQYVLDQNQLTNQGRCTLQLPGCTGQATVAHHTKGRAVTGDDLKYIVAVCAHCNGVVGEPGRGHIDHTTVTRW